MSCSTATSCDKTIAMPPSVLELMADVRAPIPALPYDVPPEADPATPWLARQLVSGWYTALQILFEQLPTEPKRILHIGGCQQRDIARRMGFLLPFAKITVLDADPAIVAKAEADIHCRFTFTHGNLPTLPLADNSVDLVLIPDISVAATSETISALLAECRRVCPNGQLIIGQRNPVLSKLFALLPGMSKTWEILEFSPEMHAVKGLWQALKKIIKPQLALQPLPFELSLYTF